MKIRKIIKQLFRVSYRLTVIHNGQYENTYSIDKKVLLQRANRQTCDYWTLYRKGPFWLRERKIASSTSERDH